MGCASAFLVIFWTAIIADSKTEILLIVMRFKPLCLLDSEVSNSAMLLSLEISTSHRAALLVEITYRLERNEIGSLDKTEVCGGAMVIVIHKHPFILA